MPYLHNISHFLGIPIFSDNMEEDSAGCIIVGKNTVKRKVLELRDAHLNTIYFLAEQNLLGSKIFRILQ